MFTFFSPQLMEIGVTGRAGRPAPCPVVRVRGSGFDSVITHHHREVDKDARETPYTLICVLLDPALVSKLALSLAIFDNPPQRGGQGF